MQCMRMQLTAGEKQKQELGGSPPFRAPRAALCPFCSQSEFHERVDPLLPSSNLISVGFLSRVLQQTSTMHTYYSSLCLHPLEIG